MSPLAAELKISLQIPVSVKSPTLFSFLFFFQRRKENIGQIAAWTLTDPGCIEYGSSSAYHSGTKQSLLRIRNTMRIKKKKICVFHVTALCFTEQ